VQIPAAWVLTGIVVAVFGLAPRLAVAGWAALAAFVLVGEIGPLLRFPQAVMNLSPFAHVPRLPGADLDLTSIAVLTVVVAALLAAGLAGFRRRDVPVS
jgi:ABC-2 type transport system permease protein